MQNKCKRLIHTFSISVRMSFSPQPTTTIHSLSPFVDYQQLQEINLELFQTLLNAFCHQTSHYDSQDECKACSVIIKNIKYMSESISNLSNLYHNAINTNNTYINEQNPTQSVVPIKQQESRQFCKAASNNNNTGKNTNSYLCYKCYSQYETEYRLNRHKKVCGESKQSQYYCYKCLKNFKTKRTLIKHEKTDEHLNRKLRRLYHTPKRENSPKNIIENAILETVESNTPNTNQLKIETKTISDHKFLPHSNTSMDLSQSMTTNPAQTNLFTPMLSESSDSEIENNSDSIVSIQNTPKPTEERNNMLSSTNIKPQPYVLYPDW